MLHLGRCQPLLGWFRCWFGGVITWKRSRWCLFSGPPLRSCPRCWRIKRACKSAPVRLRFKFCTHTKKNPHMNLFWSPCGRCLHPSETHNPEKQPIIIRLLLHRSPRRRLVWIIHRRSSFVFHDETQIDAAFFFLLPLKAAAGAEERRRGVQWFVLITRLQSSASPPWWQSLTDAQSKSYSTATQCSGGQSHSHLLASNTAELPIYYTDT